MYAGVPRTWPSSVMVISSAARLAQAEIHQMRPAFQVEHDVRGFQVSVNDAALVRIVQGVSHLRDQFGRLVETEAFGAGPSASVVPWMNSLTRQHVPSRVPASYSDTIPGCLSWAALLASAQNRSRVSGSSKLSLRGILMATSRPSSVSRAL